MLEFLIAGLIGGGCRMLTDTQVRWLGCQPEASPRIYYSNHTSHLDFLLLWSALPSSLRPHIRPVAASDYWNPSRLRGHMASRLFRPILVQRHRSEKEKAVIPLLEALEKQESLVLFPEGTRGSGESLGIFRNGLFYLAQARPHIDFVPAWIGNCFRVLPKGSHVPVPLVCSVTFGAPQRIQPGEDKAGFLGRLRQHLLSLEVQ